MPPRGFSPSTCLTGLVGLVDCFSNSLVLRVLCSLILWHFWVFIDFRLVVILLLVVQGSEGFLPMPPSWLDSQFNFKKSSVDIWVICHAPNSHLLPTASTPYLYQSCRREPVSPPAVASPLSTSSHVSLLWGGKGSSISTSQKRFARNVWVFFLVTDLFFPASLRYLRMYIYACMCVCIRTHLYVHFVKIRFYCIYCFLNCFSTT